jgi:hypothetical protein
LKSFGTNGTLIWAIQRLLDSRTPLNYIHFFINANVRVIRSINSVG